MESPKMAECISRDFNGLYFNGCYLTRELVCDILTPLDCKSLANCRLVCQLWKGLIDDPLFWKHKIKLEGKKWPGVPYDSQFPLSFYAGIYLQQPFGRNLIANPHGCERLASWTVLSEGGDGFAFEEPPAGANEVPMEASRFDDKQHRNSCFATSYHSCSKEQTINLQQLGLSEDVLNKCKPEICFADWYAGRFDCGCVYECRFSLLNKDKEPLAHYEFRQSINQWEGREWHKVSHTFTDYPDGVKYVNFYHGGTDRQFWAGHYGAKMTGSSVIINFKW